MKMDYSQQELRRSLSTGLTLMVLQPTKKIPRLPFGEWKFKWVTYAEIKQLMSSGWEVVNKQKREYLTK